MRAGVNRAAGPHRQGLVEHSKKVGLSLRALGGHGRVFSW